jgi:hypothetical protein
LWGWLNRNMRLAGHVARKADMRST